MNIKRLALIGGAAWVVYILYTNHKNKMDIADLKGKAIAAENDLKAALAQLRTTVSGLTTQPTVMPQPAAVADNSVIFPSGMKQSYDASRNATISPSPVQVGFNVENL